MVYRDTGTGLVKYEFEYSKTAGFGKLLAVQDGLGNKVTYIDIMTRVDMFSPRCCCSETTPTGCS